MPSGGPPSLTVSGDQAYLVSGPSNSASEITHPVPLGDSGKHAFIEIVGDLVLWQDGSETGRLAVDALPDAKLLVDNQQRVLLLATASPETSWRPQRSRCWRPFLRCGLLSASLSPDNG